MRKIFQGQKNFSQISNQKLNKILEFDNPEGNPSQGHAKAKIVRKRNPLGMA